MLTTLVQSPKTLELVLSAMGKTVAATLGLLI